MSIFSPGDDPQITTSRTVNGPGGAVFIVQTEQEYDWFLATREGYLKIGYTESSDLQDVDDVLGLELLRMRFQLHLTQGHDYTGEDIKDVAKMSQEIRQLSKAITDKKNSLKLSASTRKSEGAESFAEWLDDMQRKALVFKRENRLKQAQEVLRHFYKMQGMVRTFRSSDNEERLKKGITSETQILDWFLDVACPAIADVDRAFRQDGDEPQRVWKAM